MTVTWADIKNGAATMNEARQTVEDYAPRARLLTTSVCRERHPIRGAGAGPDASAALRDWDGLDSRMANSPNTRWRPRSCTVRESRGATTASRRMKVAAELHETIPESSVRTPPMENSNNPTRYAKYPGPACVH